MRSGHSALPTESASRAVVVFEKRPRWAPELERQFVDEDVRVVACRTIRDVGLRVAERSPEVILLDIAAETASCLRFLEQLRHEPNAPPVLVVGSARIAGMEWPVRDLGAAAFFPGVVPGHEMAALCRRQWSIHS